MNENGVMASDTKKPSWIVFSLYVVVVGAGDRQRLGAGDRQRRKLVIRLLLSG